MTKAQIHVRRPWTDGSPVAPVSLRKAPWDGDEIQPVDRRESQCYERRAAPRGRRVNIAPAALTVIRAVYDEFTAELE